ncbi:alpha/beta fold hydrolase [Pseudomonas sp. QL9]|uniref:alpha/beta fold hydrolase n=1 Tax=Pseudomonas sp. QL9 TaxID=3242725 RepID=UPI00352B24A6
MPPLSLFRLGPAMVLLHGFGDTGDMWAPLAADNVTEVVPGAGHWLMEEAPGPTIKAIRDFLPK